MLNNSSLVVGSHLIIKTKSNKKYISAAFLFIFLILFLFVRDGKVYTVMELFQCFSMRAGYVCKKF